MRILIKNRYVKNHDDNDVVEWEVRHVEAASLLSIIILRIKTHTCVTILLSENAVEVVEEKRKFYTFSSGVCMVWRMPYCLQMTQVYWRKLFLLKAHLLFFLLPFLPLKGALCCLIKKYWRFSWRHKLLNFNFFSKALRFLKLFKSKILNFKELFRSEKSLFL